MAAPTVRGRTAPLVGLNTAAPAATQVGDMVIVFTWEQAGAGAPTHTLQAGFVEIISHLHDDGATDGRLSVAYKIATVGGAQTYAAYTSSVGTIVRTGIIVLTVGTFAASAISKGPTAAVGASLTTNAVPNPPAVTLGATRDWLVIAIAGWHISASATVTPTAPTNYLNLQHVAGASTSEVASSERALTAPASEDPAAYGDDVTPSGSASVTIGVASPIVLTRTAAIDAAVGVASAGTFLSTLERSAALNAGLGIAAIGQFFSVFERAVAVDTAVLIASDGEVEAGVIAHERAAAIDAAIGLASAGTFFSVFERSATLDALVGVASVPQREVLRSASVTALVGIVSVPQRELLRSASVNAAVAVETAFMRELLRSAVLDAVVGVSSDGHGILERAAAIDALITIASQGFRIGEEFERSASIGIIAAIDVAGQFLGVRERSVSLGVGVEISAVPQRELLRAAALGVLVGIATAGERSGEAPPPVGDLVIAIRELGMSGAIREVEGQGAAITSIGELTGHVE